MIITLTEVVDNGNKRGQKVIATADVLPGDQTVNVIWYEGKESEDLLFEKLKIKVEELVAENKKPAEALAKFTIKSKEF